MRNQQALIDRIKNREATVGIIGLGYVGLPLAVEFAEAGFRVIGIDLADDKITRLSKGNSYIPDVPSERLRPLVESGQFTASTDYASLSNADTVNVCVPTPLNKMKDPDMSYVISAMDGIVKIAHPGMLVILESTTYPGTTQEIIVPRLEELGLTIGKDVLVAFSGERIDPGNKTYNVHNTPKVVGGMTPTCTEAAVALYSTTIDQVVPVSSPATAEMVKLLENTFRIVNIGLANEMAIACDRLGLDVWEVIEAAATKPFGFMPFFPGPGVGGHCIPIDPHYLSWKLKTLDYTTQFIELASSINDMMPGYVIDKITSILNDCSKSVRGSRIVILGVAYKSDIDDVRQSPALPIIEALKAKGADVAYHDPHVPSIRLDNGLMTRTDYSEGLLKGSDCVVIVTNHSDYDWQHVISCSQNIVDTRHATAGLSSQNTRIVQL